MNEFGHVYIRNLDLHKKTGLSLEKFKHIRFETHRCFGEIINQSNNSKASLVFNKRYIDDENKLAEIFINHAQKKRLPELFHGAIRVNNHYAAKKLNDPDLPYNYELDLKILTERSFSDRSRKNELGANADGFLMSTKHSEITGNYDEALGILRRMGAMQRKYDPPIFPFIPPSCFVPTLTEVKSMSGEWFGLHIENAKKFNVQLNFLGQEISNHEDLAIKIKKHHLSEDGRTLLLFQKAIRAAISYNSGASTKITLDLWQVTPKKLEEKNIREKDAEDLIDSKDTGAVIRFLRERIGALRI